ncbi:MAG: DUF3784 domain-containing protein [Lachnospiraceae bacterium]|nr:DUF3784 domain-containing protein [Lachnospiraceae bacterium]
MSTSDLVGAIIFFVLAAILMILSIRHFMEKGLLLNNAYLYATKEERKTMNKRPHYRQSAIVFCILSVGCFVVGLSIVLKNDSIRLLEIPIFCAAVIFAIISSVQIYRKEGR